MNLSQNGLEETVMLLIDYVSEIVNCYYKDQDSDVRKKTNEIVLEIFDKLRNNKRRFDALIRKIKNGKPTDLKPFEVEKRKTSISAEKRKTTSKNPTKHDLKKSVYNHEKQKKEVLNPDEIYKEIEVMVGEEIIRRIRDENNLTTREQGFFDLNIFITQMAAPFINQRFVKAIIGLLKLQSKEFTESNFNINMQIFRCFEILSERKEFCSDILPEFVPLILHKIMDVKFKNHILRILKKMLEHVGFELLVSSVFNSFSIIEHNVKALNEVYLLLHEVLEKPTNVDVHKLSNIILPGLNHQNHPLRHSAKLLFEKLALNIKKEQCIQILNSVGNLSFRASLESQIFQVAIGHEKSNKSKIEHRAHNNEKQLGSQISKMPSSSTDLKFGKVSTLPKQNGNRMISNSRRLKQDESMNSSGVYTKLDNPSKNIEDEIRLAIINQNPEIRKFNIERFAEHIKANLSLLSNTKIEKTFEMFRLRINDSNANVSKCAIFHFHKMLEGLFSSFKQIHKQILYCFLDLLLHKNVI